MQHDQPLVFELTASPDELFAGAESWEEPPRVYWYRMAWGDRGFRRLSIPGCGEVVDFVTSSTELAALCRNPGSVVLARRKLPATEWSLKAVPVLLDESGAELAIAADQVAIVTGRRIGWGHRDLPWQELPFVGRTELEQGAAPVSALIGQGALWLGYNAGEFGGGLYFAGISDDGRLEQPRLVRDLNVEKILEASDGSVWIAGGLAHLGLREVVLLHARDGGLQTVVEQRNWEGSTSAETLVRPSGLPEETWLDALTLHEGVDPIVILGTDGIFTMRDAAMHRILSVDLQTSYPCHGARCVSGATDLVQGPDSSFYVATSLLSVIRLRRGLLGHSVEQLLLPDLPGLPTAP